MGHGHMESVWVGGQGRIGAQLRDKGDGAAARSMIVYISPSDAVKDG